LARASGVPSIADVVETVNHPDRGFCLPMTSQRAPMRKKPVGVLRCAQRSAPGGQGLTQIGTLRVGSAPGVPWCFTSDNSYSGKKKGGCESRSSEPYIEGCSVIGLGASADRRTPRSPAMWARCTRTRLLDNRTPPDGGVARRDWRARRGGLWT